MSYPVAEGQFITVLDAGADVMPVSADPGGLVIRQVLESDADVLIPLTSVYRIDAVLDGELVYSNVYAVDQDSTSSQERVIDLESNVPVGSDVEVTLLYAGSLYDVTDGTSRSVSLNNVSYDSPIEVEFSLSYIAGDWNLGLGYGGYGIENHFRVDPAGIGPFELPATGSFGTHVFIMAGLALGLCGIAGLRSARRRRGVLALILALAVSGMGMASMAYAAPRSTGAGRECVLHENVDPDLLVKKIVVENVSEDYAASAIWVSAFCPSGYSLEWAVPEGEWGPWWTHYDDTSWARYGDVLMPGRFTCDRWSVGDNAKGDLTVYVKTADGEDVTPGPEPHDFNVIVVLEYMLGGIPQ